MKTMFDSNVYVDNKNILLVRNEFSVEIYRSRKKIMRKKVETDQEVYDGYGCESLKNKLFKKNVYIIFEGEEFYIKLIKIPNVRKRLINQIITNELQYIFNDIHKFYFTYDVIEKSKESINILVFCINSNKRIVFEHICQNCNVKSIYLVQLCYFEYIKNKIEDYKCYVVITIEKNTYILVSVKHKIMANMVISDNAHLSSNDMIERFKYLTFKIDEMKLNLKDGDEEYKVVFINTKSDIILEISNQGYGCTDFGSISVDEVMYRIGRVE